MRSSENRTAVRTIHALIGAICIGGNVLTLVALKLGATEMFLGILIFAILAPWAFRIFTMSAIEKHGKRKILIFWKTISTLCIIPFLLLPFLVNRWSANACLILILTATFLRSATYALGNTGWFPLLQDIVPRRITGRFFANLRVAWQTSSFITLLLVAWFLGKEPDWWKFEVIFIVAFLAFTIRFLTIFGMVEKPVPQTTSKKFSIFARFCEVLRAEQLRRLVLYIISYMFALVIAEPFKIKFLKDLGYGDGYILAATSMAALGAIISLRFWGKLADKFGNHSIFSISHIGIAVFTILWLFVGKSAFGAVFVFGLFFFWSVFNSGNGIAQTRYILHAVPEDRQNQINIISTIAMLAASIAPLFGGLFLKLTGNISFQISAKTIDNYHFLFIISAAMFILPHILRRKLKSKKDTPTMQVIAFVTRPLRNMFGPFMGSTGKQVK
jgi:MFS family permease